ncbi:MAG: class I SAM-dependent methyltransferase [Candidatus Falkowbacteria bacterium]
MKSTYAERLLPEEAKDQLIYDEHLVRYQLAQKLAVGKVVLDVASGEGYGSAMLAKTAATVTGVDISEEALSKARAKYAHLSNLHFVADSAQSLAKIASQSIDLVVSFETIEHLPDYQQYLIALARVLKPNGLALISTPNKELFHEENPFHLKEFSKKEFAEALKDKFAFVKIYEQANGLASVIKTEGKQTQLTISSGGAAQYFIALCSPDAHCLTRLETDIISFNALAHERRENNPAWKMINRLYKIYKKVF